LQTQKAYYKAVLYPFQDGIISMMNELGTDFYLTGGTALSRAYYNHRFSDALDYFTHNDPDFLNHVKLFLKALNDFGFLSKIIWNIDVNVDTFFKEIAQISQELIHGVENTLC